MDATAVTALVDEATKRAGLVWVRSVAPGHRPQPVWHVWHDGAAWVLTGGLEQPAPPDLADVALVTVASKDKRSRLVTWEADVSVIDPGSDTWEEVAPLLVAKRLNLPDGEGAPARWARECTLFRLAPTGRVTETPDEPSTSSHAADPPPTPARTRTPRPLHLRGRPARNRGGH